MKYKIISIVIMMLGVFAMQNVDIKNNRYHQHLEVQEKSDCTQHGEDVFCTHCQS